MSDIIYIIISWYFYPIAAGFKMQIHRAPRPQYGFYSVQTASTSKSEPTNDPREEATLLKYAPYDETNGDSHRETRLSLEVHPPNSPPDRYDSSNSSAWSHIGGDTLNDKGIAGGYDFPAYLYDSGNTGRLVRIHDTSTREVAQFPTKQNHPTKHKWTRSHQIHDRMGEIIPEELSTRRYHSPERLLSTEPTEHDATVTSDRVVQREPEHSQRGPPPAYSVAVRSSRKKSTDLHESTAYDPRTYMKMRGEYDIESGDPVHGSILARYFPMKSLFFYVLVCVHRGGSGILK